MWVYVFGGCVEGVYDEGVEFFSFKRASCFRLKYIIKSCICTRPLNCTVLLIIQV